MSSILAEQRGRQETRARYTGNNEGKNDHEQRRHLAKLLKGCYFDGKPISVVVNFLNVLGGIGFVRA